MKKFLIFFISSLSLLFGELSPDSEGAQNFNATLADLRGRLKDRFEKAAALTAQGADEGEYRNLLLEVKSLKSEIALLEEEWRTASIRESLTEDGAYALWVKTEPWLRTG